MAAFLKPEKARRCHCSKKNQSIGRLMPVETNSTSELYLNLD
jgi:hypothetical protein